MDQTSLFFKNFKLVDDMSFLGQFNTVTHQVWKQFQWSLAKLLQMGKSCTTLNEWIRQIGIDLLKSSVYQARSKNFATSSYQPLTVIINSFNSNVSRFQNLPLHWRKDEVASLNEWVRLIVVYPLKSSSGDKNVFLITLGDTLSKCIVFSKISTRSNL